MNTKYFISAMIIAISLGLTAPALATDYGAGTAARAAGLTVRSGGLPALAGDVIGRALTFVGVLFFVLMLYGGITWMLARGNEEYSRKAIGTITAAIIGLIIIAGSYAITQFVFNAATGGGSGGSGAGGGGGSGGGGAGGSGQVNCCIYRTTDGTNISPETASTDFDESRCLALCRDNPQVFSTGSCRFSQVAQAGDCRP